MIIRSSCECRDILSRSLLLSVVDESLNHIKIDTVKYRPISVRQKDTVNYRPISVRPKDTVNYRPISVLIIISKIFEKTMYNHLISFIDKEDIL